MQQHEQRDINSRKCSNSRYASNSMKANNSVASNLANQEASNVVFLKLKMKNLEILTR
jgi:hypothetical protein